MFGVLGFDPIWEDLGHGARPPPAELEDMEPCSGRGWQHVAASTLGGVAGAEPQSAVTRIPPHLFRVVLLRRLQFPLPLSLHTCRCGATTEHRVHEQACRGQEGFIGKCNSQSLSGGRWEG